MTRPLATVYLERGTGITSCRVSRRWSSVFRDFRVSKALVGVMGTAGIN